jgi:DNA-binding NtrC family response regulator
MSSLYLELYKKCGTLKESRKRIKFELSQTPAKSFAFPKESSAQSLKSFVPHILIVDDDELICSGVEQVLVEYGYAVSKCREASEALQELETENIDLVVTDVRLPGMSGVELTKRIFERWPDVPIIVMTGFSEIEIAVEVLKLGASDFIRKPFTPAAIQESVRVVLEQSQVFVDIRHMRNEFKERCEFGGMLSRTNEMHSVFETIRMVAETDATVVVEGETGTGKELVATAIHHQSKRKEGPFVAINCAGIPETLLESELFGYERGAFTGADYARAGKIELAHGGTLFLDEIESMPLSMQAKLLLVLENQKVQRLGSNRWTQIDMRVVAATNVPLKELKSQGLMRSDFYYRLNVVLIPLLPLRHRIEDIPLLVQDFLRHQPIAKRKNITKVSKETMTRLMSYDWPGNIRELQNVLEKALVLCRSRIIENVELPDAPSNAEPAPEWSSDLLYAEEGPLDEWIKAQERAYLIRRLEESGGRIDLTAKSCGVDVRTLHRKMRLHGLDKKDFSRGFLRRHSRPTNISYDTDRMKHMGLAAERHYARR